MTQLFKPSVIAWSISTVFCALHTSAWAQSTTQNTEAKESPNIQQTQPVVVTATAQPRKQTDVLTPTSVLRNGELRLSESTNLGQTVSNQPGVTSSNYASGAGRPIVRGMDSTRVLVAEGGLGVADVSSASPDHRVTADTFNAQQVEVLRGPQTLLYGSGAIGGLVNIVSQRIPTNVPTQATGSVVLKGNWVDQERLGALNLTTPLNQSTALRIEGFSQKTGDTRLAKPLVDDAGTVIAQNRLPNSQTDTQSFAIGLGHQFNDGHFGAAIQRYDSTYGIPNPEDPVTIKMRRERFEVQGAWQFNQALIKELRTQFAYTDYAHTEFESDGTPGARFTNRGQELRVQAAHLPLAGFEGVVGIHASANKVSGSGEGELPATKRNALALFAVQEKTFGPVRAEVGLRAERERFDVQEDTSAGVRKPNRSFSLLSSSWGAKWTVMTGWELGARFDMAQRAPQAEELYFEGAHPATFAYEFGNTDLRKERSRNIELSVQKLDGPVRLKASLFHNTIKDYVYGRFDGSTTDILDAAGNVQESINNLFFEQANARFTGAELEMNVGDRYGFNGRVWSDIVRARLTSGPHAGDNVPRISPARLGVDLRYAAPSWAVTAHVLHVTTQKRTSNFDIREGVPEQPTAGYTTLDLSGYWQTKLSNRNTVTVFAKASNLTNKQGFVHTSFLKPFVPIQARSLSVGTRLSF